MNKLFIAYFFRNNLWSDFFPSFFILIECVFPIDIMALIFILLSKPFKSIYSMNPFDLRTNKVFGISSVKIMMLNNIILIICGSVFFLLIETIIFFYRNLVLGVVNLSSLYRPIPCLIFSILIGNIYYILSRSRILRSLVLDFAYSILIILFVVTSGFLNSVGILYLAVIVLTVYFSSFYFIIKIHGRIY